MNELNQNDVGSMTHSLVLQDYAQAPGGEPLPPPPPEADDPAVPQGEPPPPSDPAPPAAVPGADPGATTPVPPPPPPVVPQRTFVAAGVQALPEYAVHGVTTESAPLKHSGMCHTEGGWPAEVDPTDGEQVARWRKRVERDEDYIRTVLRLGAVVEDIVRQNAALDIYADYFGDAAPLSLAAPSVATLAALRHPLGERRAVQALAWGPDGSGHVATAFAAGDDAFGGLAAVYDAAMPTAPVATLTGPSPALCLAYNPKDHAILGAGQRNGQFALFDVRHGPAPAAATDPAASHTDALTGAAWTQSKTGTEFMTASLDGSVAWWDSRRLGERLEGALLRERTAAGGAGPEGPGLGATCLEYSVSAGPAKFMVGTATGAILTGNRRAKNPAERITGTLSGHVSAVASLSRHPFFPKHFLSVGDWTARVWSEDLHAPLVATPCRAAYVTASGWSPARPAVFFAAGADGRLEAWDLLQSHAAPVLSASLTDAPLTALAVQEAGRAGLLAVGCADGATLVVRPGEGLAQTQGDEKTAFTALMEREGGRERGLEKAAKEAKARARREAARAAEPVTRVTDEDLQQLERRFLAALSGGA